MASYEGKWRCVRCSTVNPGRNLSCLACGVKRSDDVQFFLDDDAAVLTDEVLLNQANAGANWICQYCDGGNAANNERCSSCGNARSLGDKQLDEETRDINAWSETAQANYSAIQPRTVTSPPKSSLFKRLLLFGLIGTGLFAVFGIAIFALLIFIGTREYPVEIEVSGLEWERIISLEEYRTVTETGWEGEIPANARIQSNERAIHHTDQIPSGTRSVPETYTEEVSDGTERYVCGRINKKNGYFEDKYCTRTKYKTVTKSRTRTETIYKSVPVYKTRFTYLVDKWVSSGEKKTSGVDFNPQWATFEVDNIRTREAGRMENYNLICKELGGENKPHKMKLPPQDLPKIQNGLRLHGKLDFANRLISIDEFPNIKRE